MLLFLASLYTTQAAGIHFPELIAQVDRATFGPSQLLIISTIPENESLSTKEVKRLMDEFVFPKDKLQALEILSPNISDPHNGYLLLEAFDFASDRRTAQKNYYHHPTRRAKKLSSWGFGTARGNTSLLGAKGERVNQPRGRDTSAGTQTQTMEGFLDFRTSEIEIANKSSHKRNRVSKNRKRKSPKI